MKKFSFMLLQNKKAKITLLFLLSLIMYFSFGFNHIGKFSTVDELHWLYDRIPQYWKGVTQQKWKLTYIHEKPGITLAIVSGTGLLEFDNPLKYEKQNNPGKTKETMSMENFYTAFRLPILIFNGLFSIFFFWVMRKITRDSWISLWSSILILSSPILLGMTQMVNSDALLWTFTTATILSFVALLKTSEKKLAFLTALFLGLSVLTKFTSVILMPFLFVISFIFYFEKIKDWQKNNNDSSREIMKISLNYLSIILGSIVVFALLMPASIIKPKYLYEGTIGYPGMEFVLWPILGIQILIIIDGLISKNKITINIIAFLQKIWEKYSKIIQISLSFSFILLLVNYAFGSDFLGFEKIPFDAYQEPIFYQQNWLKKMLLEFRPIIFSLTPLVLFSVIYVWIKSIFKPIKENVLVATISLFFLIFCAAVIQEKLLNIIRYSIIIYPLMSVLAAIGISELLSGKKNEKISKTFVTIIIIAISFVSLWQIKPFYLNYTSDLLPKKYVITDAWGYGGYEAAQYLNSLPDAANKSVWSDSTGVCEFFIGTCRKSKCEFQDDSTKFDYLVFSRRGEILFSREALTVKSRLCNQNKDIYDTISKGYSSKDKAIFNLSIDGRPANSITVVEAR
ncbi:MAG: hypothetical protein ACD_8C00047G0017 [uncultured bacterium]|nr:MAG: hypothetical protein ACD_8C00047G0017 [uncultured bacterium]